MRQSMLIDMAITAPPAEWCEIANRWIDGLPGKGHLPTVDRRGDMGDAIRSLDAAIERLARFRAYLDARYGHGCGDHGHEKGVKAQNSLAAKVRRVLGFTYPRADFNFSGDL